MQQETWRPFQLQWIALDTTAQQSIQLFLMDKTVSAIHTNDTASLKVSNFVTYSSYNSSGTADVATTNSIWIAMMASRSTSTIHAGTVPWRIKKIILRERRLS
jgi:hypothetical protein